MSVDRPKILNAAQKYLAKGQFDRAIKEYRKLVEEDPNDVRIWLKVGDLYQKNNENKEAVETYNRVADYYAEQGFFLKAVAVYKRIIKLQPNRLDISLRLAEMYENLQLISDALGTFEHVAAAYAREGDMDNMLLVLGKMAGLDPENIPVRIKNAEALSKAGKTDEAAGEFEAGAELLKAQGRIDDYLKVAERLLYHRPTDVPLARELARMYVDRDDAKRALGKLQICFKSDPKDAETLELLGRAFHLLDQTPKTISVYRELARVHQEAGRPDERARILNEILRLDPNDGEARQALAAYAPPSSPRAAAPVDDDDEPELEIIEPEDDDIELVEDYEDFEEIEEIRDSALAPALEAADDDDDDMGLEIVEDDPIIIDEGLPEAYDQTDILDPPTVEAPLGDDSGSVRPSIPPAIAREAQIARLLTECEVFERYGLSDKVVRQLRQVLEIAPDHVEAREKLKDMLISLGDKEGAAAELETLAYHLEQANPQVAALYRRQADTLLGPRVEEATSRHDDLPPPPSADDESSEAILFVDDELEDLSAPRVDMLSDLPMQPDDSSAYGDPVLDMDLPTSPAGSILPPPGDPFVEPPTPLHPMMLDDDGDTTMIGAMPDLLPPAPPAEALLDLDSGLAALPPLVDIPEGERAERDAIKRNSMPPGEVEEILDEVDFYIAQGLWDAGAGTLQDALTSFPEHPVLLDKLQEIHDGRAAQAASVPPMEEAPDDVFALAEKLAEELGPVDADEAGSDVLDVDQVFEQFKRGVQEQVGIEDSETHFDLGIAYKEMGLLDDAVGEFELAMSNAQRECICHTMIGLCRIEQGRLSEAIGHFKKGLYVEQKTDAEEVGLYYELGVAYQALEDPQEAIYYLQKVVKREPTFRDAEPRLTKLSSPDTALPPPPALELDDLDAAFDDLMGDD